MRNHLKTTTYLCSVAAFVLAMSATPARAALIVDGGLTLNTDPTDFYQQTDASPCVIGGSNCQNPAGFPKTLAGPGGNGSLFTEVSPLYTTAQITGVTGSSSFIVGFDYNQNVDPQTLYYFEANYYNGAALLSSQVFDVETVLQVINNGVGYSDFLMSGFVIPVGATNVQFEAKWYNNDGADRYFIIGANSPPPCQVGDPGCDVNLPEPASLALFGLAAFAAGIARRRRK